MLVVQELKEIYRSYFGGIQRHEERMIPPRDIRYRIDLILKAILLNRCVQKNMKKS